MCQGDLPTSSALGHLFLVVSTAECIQGRVCFLTC